MAKRVMRSNRRTQRRRVSQLKQRKKRSKLLKRTLKRRNSFRKKNTRKRRKTMMKGGEERGEKAERFEGDFNSKLYTGSSILPSGQMVSGLYKLAIDLEELIKNTELRVIYKSFGRKKICTIASIDREKLRANFRTYGEIHSSSCKKDRFGHHGISLKDLVNKYTVTVFTDRLDFVKNKSP